MSEKDLVKELKAEIVEITKDRDDALAKVKSKESRMKQVLIKLEHREQDIHTCGHKIGEQNKEIAIVRTFFQHRRIPVQLAQPLCEEQYVMSVVQLHILDVLVDARVVLQHNHVLWHVEVVQTICYLHSLSGGEMSGVSDHAQHVLVIEVEVPDVTIDGFVAGHTVQLYELHLAVDHGLLSERTGW